MKSSRGFTIIELMVATAVFSVILVIVTSGALHFSNEYYKGITSNNTQSAARAVANQISQDLQFSAGNYTLDNNQSYYCIGSDIYRGSIGTEFEGSTSHALVVSQNSVCNDGAGMPSANSLATTTGARELLSPNMRLGNLSITVADDNLYTVDVTVIYGDDDLLYPAIVGGPTNWSQENCSGQAGDQFCATASLSSIVEKRVQ